MGLNITGIATSRVIHNIEDINALMGTRTTSDKETTIFEAALSSYCDDKDIFITNVENGTIITVGLDVPFYDMSLKELSQNGKALRFGLSETSMTFAFDYFENGQLVRSVMTQEGEPLEIENVESETNLIAHLMQEITGESFWTLDLEAKSERYRIA